ncbi:hypothetical protein [Plantibacter sp. ME-Dv--P-122b]|uniref:hypothetical protein n=1 Tax=Plantibacter sp. ME-Dv--P-122b TaxID=3040300 RepID=UPI00254F6958|nr:hypothetical protein [Plantibacter sp. ME-Dv--P-122b]
MPGTRSAPTIKSTASVAVVTDVPATRRSTTAASPRRTATVILPRDWLAIGV